MGAVAHELSVPEAELMGGALLVMCAQWKLAQLKRHHTLEKRSYKTLKKRIGQDATRGRLPVRVHLPRYTFQLCQGHNPNAKRKDTGEKATIPNKKRCVPRNTMVMQCTDKEAECSLNNLPAPAAACSGKPLTGISNSPNLAPCSSDLPTCLSLLRTLPPASSSKAPAAVEEKRQGIKKRKRKLRYATSKQVKRRKNDKTHKKLQGYTYSKSRKRLLKQAYGMEP